MTCLRFVSVAFVGDMHPVRAFRVVLHDELVKLAVLFDVLETMREPFLHVAVDAEVCRLALHVL